LKKISELIVEQNSSGDPSRSSGEGDVASGPVAGQVQLEPVVASESSGESDDDTIRSLGSVQPGTAEDLDGDDESCSQMAEGRGDIFLKCVQEVQQLTAMQEGSKRLVAECAVWALSGRVAEEFYRNYGKDHERYVSQRVDAERAKYIQRKPYLGSLQLRLTKYGMKYMRGVPSTMTFDNYKLALCGTFRKSGRCDISTCPFSNNRFYAHSFDELHEWPSRQCEFCSKPCCLTDGHLLEVEGAPSWLCLACWERQTLFAQTVCANAGEQYHGVESRDGVRQASAPSLDAPVCANTGEQYHGGESRDGCMARMLKLIQTTQWTLGYRLCPGILCSKYEAEAGTNFRDDFTKEYGFDSDWKVELAKQPGIIIDPHTDSDIRISFVESARSGDWLCPNCDDHQFARNWTCRYCGTAWQSWTIRS